MQGNAGQPIPPTRWPLTEFLQTLCCCSAGRGGKPDVPCGSFELMNGDVKRALSVPDAVTHHNDNSQVFSAQYEEFMQPATGTGDGQHCGQPSRRRLV